ncbi:urease accessory protein UreF [Alteribacillus sp. HJP-4]
MQLHDSAFPIGSYTQSFGMETYIQAGVLYNEETLKQFCLSYLHGNLVGGDGLIVKEVHRAALENDYELLEEAGVLCHALKIPKESREGSIWMGKQFLKTISAMDELGPGPSINLDLSSRNMYFHYPVVYGMYTALSKMELSAALTAFLYSSVSGMVHNAVRAVPLGQTSGVKTIYQLLPECEKAAKRIDERTLSDAGSSTAGLELASMKHEHLRVRLFIS